MPLSGGRVEVKAVQTKTLIKRNAKRQLKCITKPCTLQDGRWEDGELETETETETETEPRTWERARWTSERGDVNSFEWATRGAAISVSGCASCRCLPNPPGAKGAQIKCEQNTAKFWLPLCVAA